jgi:hypothetical protein
MLFTTSRAHTVRHPEVATTLVFPMRSPQHSDATCATCEAALAQWVGERASRLSADSARETAEENARFLREQLRSARRYFAHLAAIEIEAIAAERDALLAEITVLHGELRIAPAERAHFSAGQDGG